MAHLILNVHEVPKLYTERISDAAKMLELLLRVATTCEMSVLNQCSHQFEPFGATAMLLLGESHMTIHTWPESHALYIDVFHCGHNAHTRLEKAANLFKTEFAGAKFDKTVVDR